MINEVEQEEDELNQRSRKHPYPMKKKLSHYMKGLSPEEIARQLKSGKQKSSFS
ncbi:hypothetical protein PO124_00550 [Bacillus licheniformis]|nr:hypothetical protein [Bacillus licheniformis]